MSQKSAVGTGGVRDPFDPVGQPLRQLSRDGVVIGACSFGGNQRDDGGSRKQGKPFLRFGPLDPSGAAPAGRIVVS